MQLADYLIENNMTQQALAPACSGTPCDASVPSPQEQPALHQRGLAARLRITVQPHSADEKLRWCDSLTSASPSGQLKADAGMSSTMLDELMLSVLQQHGARQCLADLG